ncbi:MAG: hypothetical protein KBT88_09625 [Gammaproteobacteria bacterium]|nr:hypothetical protein [Gammaproteobacteria bacterium]MBQ0840033.1 hypothetical protein [Gammaproteobacteria bacterium]
MSIGGGLVLGAIVGVVWRFISDPKCRAWLEERAGRAEAEEHDKKIKRMERRIDKSFKSISVLITALYDEFIASLKDIDSSGSAKDIDKILSVESKCFSIKGTSKNSQYMIKF